MIRLCAISALLMSAPAQAAGTAVSEPSGLALLGLGVLGLLVGRHGARRRRD